MREKYTFNIRVTGILIEHARLLIVKQKIEPGRNWSLPGGRVESGESLREAMIREMKEETGLNVKCVKLLYVCEKQNASPPILHITFLLERESGEIRLPTNEFDENPIADVRFVDITELKDYDFSDRFIQMIRDGFPESGSYMGAKSNIGL